MEPISPRGPRRSAAQKALFMGVLLWASGFGALLTFSFVVSSRAALPGLFDFWSATWGDGLLLPVSAAALVYSLTKLQPPGRHERLIMVIAAATAAAAGAATQIQWLRDNHPRLNWTLPRPHHFNAAGIYHAIFLVAASATFAVLWAGVLLRLTAARRLPRTSQAGRCQVSVALMIALSTGLGFVVLLALDNRPSAGTRAGHATVLAAATATITLAIAGLGVILSTRRRRRRG